MNNKLKTQAVEQLFQAILSLKDLDEAYDFFEDVCTINEILSLSQRFEVAKMLREHRTYLDIAETGMTEYLKDLACLRKSQKIISNI